MRKFIAKLKRDERGVSALEYAILAAVIAGAVVAAVGVFGPKLSTAFGNLGDKVTEAVDSIDAGGSSGTTTP